MTVITNNQAPVPESHDGYGNGPSKRAVDANGNPNVGLPWHGAGLPHVEDIASAPTDIDANQSIKRLLDQSQTLMGQADMFRELGRIDFALREYIKSYTIAFQTVPNHDEYTSLPNDRPELYKRHRALKAQLDTHFNTYMQIKEQIRADNLRTGVKPTRVHHVRTQTSSHTRSGSNVSVNNPAPGAARQSLDQYVGADARPKPPVQPKPQSLHGRALQNGHVKSSSVSSAGDSLTARFKNLGGPTTSPGQDPRIRTHPIAAPKPAGPREMPSAAKPALGVDTTSPFPARPAAIYVPTRPNMTAEAAQLPSSATRTHPSRSGSYASHPGTPNGTVKPPSNDYFTPPSRSNTGLSNGRVSLSENRNEIQSGETISPSELKTLMNKYSILIIDTRARSEFDEGHIMSTSIICVEPDILSRGDIGAADIADSLILSPSHEQEIFNKRNEYDLIVYYNQMSKSLQSPPSSLEEQVIVSLHRALTLLNDPPLKRNPKLLKGGLDAWIDFLGPACLQATVASDADRPKLLPPGPRSRRRSSYVPIELPQQDIEGFQEDINREYYRTQDDFVKRYPAVPVKQESMVLSSPQQVPQRPFARPPAPTESIPKPLQAPEPAKARASHTYHGSHDGSHDGGSNMRGTGAGTIPGAIGTKMTWRTGLDNPHNWCYANSVIQSLLVSNFGSELAEATQWKRRYIVPRKQGEKTAPPQLMIQMLSNLFYWMENKSFKVMKADTLLVSGDKKHFSPSDTRLTKIYIEVCPSRQGTTETERKNPGFCLVRRHQPAGCPRVPRMALVGTRQRDEYTSQCKRAYWRSPLAQGNATT